MKIEKLIESINEIKKELIEKYKEYDDEIKRMDDLIVKELLKDINVKNYDKVIEEIKSKVVCISAYDVTSSRYPLKKTKGFNIQNVRKNERNRIYRVLYIEEKYIKK
jgi:hypothetical protein